MIWVQAILWALHFSFSGAPADVNAVAVDPVQAMRWEADALEGYLAANPDTPSVMQRPLARDLAGKLERSVNSNWKKSGWTIRLLGRRDALTVESHMLAKDIHCHFC